MTSLEKRLLSASKAVLECYETALASAVDLEQLGRLATKHQPVFDELRAAVAAVEQKDEVK